MNKYTLYSYVSLSFYMFKIFVSLSVIQIVSGLYSLELWFFHRKSKTCS